MCWSLFVPRAVVAIQIEMNMAHEVIFAPTRQRSVVAGGRRGVGGGWRGSGRIARRWSCRRGEGVREGQRGYRRREGLQRTVVARGQQFLLGGELGKLVETRSGLVWEGLERLEGTRWGVLE